jgi:hypothetical protein
MDESGNKREPIKTKFLWVVKKARLDDAQPGLGITVNKQAKKTNWRDSIRESK